MIVQEAINNIDDVLSSAVNYDESIDYQLTSDDIDWLEKAKEALEKQISKKPIHYEQSYPCCPDCGEFITSRDKNYCDNCGQALDWSECE